MSIPGSDSHPDVLRTTTTANPGVMTAGGAASPDIIDADIPAEGAGMMAQPDFSSVGTELMNSDVLCAGTSASSSTCCATTQTDLSSDQIASMQDQIDKLVGEKLSLQEKLHAKSLYESFFKDSDKNVKFYTGLPSYAHLMAIFAFLSGHISVTSQSALTAFQQKLLTLMKLRHNYPFQDLADRFGVSPATCSKVFQKILDVLYIQLGWLVRWPTREELRQTMPVCFREHYADKVTAIIDCFEVFLDRPTSLLPQAQTWSSYKHHNTVKFLIGVAPHGYISLISKAWGEEPVINISLNTVGSLTTSFRGIQSWQIGDLTLQNLLL